MKVKLTLNEEMLGMLPSDQNIYRDFIQSRNPSGISEEEDESIDYNVVRETLERGTTVFPRDEDGCPFMWDYQIKGAFKEKIKMLKRAGSTGYEKGKACSKLTCYQKRIDGNLFIFPRKIKIIIPDGMSTGSCSRSLRAQVAGKDYTSIAMSETVPAGSIIKFEIVMLGDALDKPIREALDYGELHGLGQWRNSGKGVFSWEEIK